ncbi:hypothetical protein N6H18_17955 [Reichenbachiella agarivorans]|uniref:Uncharacterized protein n=1 Tax=Reichenbachiella agarivorans TaxID=2979464 RepID=A0ABY6CNY5_9BACT|nr:hypothetical protein [Reichenbachiella agarivorans]UXP32227.1 hypothetical protein N6H18_17955 [Reichenbachiella agarivorans]
MKKLVSIAIGLLAAATAIAQDLSPYAAYQIKENVKVEILEIKRVEKYGWDNLEVSYRLINESNYDLQKVDFLVHLIDVNQNEIGTVELFAFDIPKKSDDQYKSIEVLSPYANENVTKHYVETKAMDVMIGQQNQTVSIQSTQSVRFK